MSRVIAEPGLRTAIAVSIYSYMNNFWFWLDDAPRLQYGSPGLGRTFDSYAVQYYVEKWELFRQWFSGEQGISSVFYQKWKNWEFGDLTNVDEVALDWPPPAEYLLFRLKLPWLPQEPQIRRVIRGPNGEKRSIRVKP